MCVWVYSFFLHNIFLVNNTALFSTLIARTSQDIDILIDSLPSQEYTQDRQDSTLRKLEAENRLAAETLRKTVEAGGKLPPLNQYFKEETVVYFYLEILLKKIRLALEEISNSELGINATSKQSSSSSE